jgi:uncharacterized membrane protein
MDKMVIVVFDSERKAYEGARALRDLDADGSISIYASAVLAKSQAGDVEVKQAVDSGPIGTAVGLLTGTLVGLFTGPIGLAAGLAAGALGGVVYDLAKIGVNEDFLADAGEALAPGRFAVIAEVWEEWVTPLDARMAAAGGSVLRRARAEVLDAQLDRDAATLRTELASLKAELAATAQQARGKLETTIDGVKTKLRDTQARTQQALEAAKQESAAKVQALQAKRARLHDERKAKLDARIEEVQAEYKVRSEKLSRAWELTKQALAV